MNSMMIENFTFNHVGDFYRNEIRSKKQYSWGDKNNKQKGHLYTCINLFDDDFDKATELAYLVTVDEEVMYVGEFSNSFRDRWLITENYIWHHKDELIRDALREGKKVSLWFINEPCSEVYPGVNINICKSIEHHILKNKNLAWNKRNN